MKTPLSLAAALLALLATPNLRAQQPAAPPPPPPVNFAAERAPLALPPGPALPVTIGTVTPGDFHTIVMVDPTTGVPVSQPEEARFDLEFPGGTPEDLVRYLEDAGVGTLNTIIPQDLADTPIPAMRAKAVTVPQLFEALTEASRKTVAVPMGTGFPAPYAAQIPFQMKETSFGFRTRGTPSAASIWYFFADRPPVTTPPVPPKVVRFYQLAPYLEPDRYTVDDITTAIQTGWRMLGDESPPELNFHKDTKLLIAFGTEPQLRIIEDVLSQLSPRAATTPLRQQAAPRPVPPAPQPEAAPPAPLPAPSRY